MFNAKQVHRVFFVSASVLSYAATGATTPTGISGGPYTVPETSVEDTLIGNILNKASGSTLSLVSTLGNRIKLQNSQILVGPTGIDFEAGTPLTVQVREVLGSYDVVTDFTVNVTNVNEQPNLQALTLSNDTVSENLAQGGSVGSVQNKTSGSTLTLTNDAGGRFALVAGAIQRGATPLDWETATTHQIEITETLADSANSPRVTTLPINVTNAFEQPDLNALTLSQTNLTQGQEVTIFIESATTGSVITGTVPDGLTINSAARTITGTPTTVNAAAPWELIETLGDSSNSPRTSSGTMNVSAAGLMTTAAVTGDLIDRHTTSYGNGSIYQANEDIPLATRGYVLKVTFAQALTGFDPTKFIVNIDSPGYQGNGTTTTRQRTARGTILLRRAVPNKNSPYAAIGGDAANTYYIVMDNVVYGGDTITSVDVLAGAYTGVTPYNYVVNAVSASNLAYPEPLPALVLIPFERIGSSGTLAVEITGIHEHGQAGQMFARVEAWLVDKNGLAGAVASSSVMDPYSDWTPASGWMPGYRFPAHKLTLSAAGLADGAAKVYYKVYPFVGNSVWDSAAKGAAWPSIIHQVDYKPVYIDTAGNHSPVYAWVNQDGVAGASPAVQTGTADPGSAASYANAAAALTAIKAWNNNAANRAVVHNDCSGGVIMLRDVAGSTEGADAGAYNISSTVWSSTSTYPMGELGVEVRRAADPNTPSDAVRLRWTGASAASVTAKNVGPRVRWRGLKFDSTGKTAREDNTIIYGQGPSTGNYTYPAFHTFIDCDVKESTSTTLSISTFSWAYQVGLATFIRTRIRDATTATGATGVGFSSTSGSFGTSSGTANANIGHLYVGCSLETPTGYQSVAIIYGAMLGCYSNAVLSDNNGRLASAVTGGLPTIDGIVVMNSRFDVVVAAPLTGSSVFSVGNNMAPIYRGFGLCNVLVTTMGNYETTAVAIANDGKMATALNVVLRHVTVDNANTANTGSSASFGRINFMYNDQGFLNYTKRGSMMFSVSRGYNIKGDPFLAPETVSSFNNAWATGLFYSRGTIAHDNGGTKTYYQAVADHVAGATMATDFADTTKWRLLGQIGATTFGEQPLRVGNWQVKHNVRMWHNVIGLSANSSSFGPDSWLGETPGRGQSTGTDMATWWASRHTGAVKTGTYRPAAGSPLLNKVPAGSACVPIDLLGTLRLNDGTGAAGALERVGV